MIRTSLTAALLAVAAMSLHAAELPKAVAPRYDSLLATIRKADTKGFATFFARDFVAVDPAGKTSNRAAYLKEIGRFFHGARSAETRFRCTSAVQKGDTIQVGFDFHVTLRGKPGGDLVGHEVGTDYWKKTGGRWRIVKTVDKSFDVKPVRPGRTIQLKRR